MNPLKILWKLLTWPFRQAYEIFKNAFLGIVSDIRFIKKFIKHAEGDTPLFNPSKVKAFKEEMLSLTPATIIKEYWHWLLLAGFTLCVGYLWGLTIASVECNNYVIKEFLTNPMVSISMENIGYNISNLLYH